MRKTYRKALAKCFNQVLVRTRMEQALTQSQMAEKLAMDERSYIDLDHGKSCCSAVTLALFLIYCCGDPLGFLGECSDALPKRVDAIEIYYIRFVASIEAMLGKKVVHL